MWFRVSELTNVGVENLLVASLALLQLQLHLQVLPSCQQNHVLVVGLFQPVQGRPCDGDLKINTFIFSGGLSLG